MKLNSPDSIEIDLLEQPIVYPRPADTDSYVRHPWHKTEIIVQSDYPNRDEFHKAIRDRIEALRLQTGTTKLLDLKILMDGWSVYGLMGIIDYVQADREQLKYLRERQIKLTILRTDGKEQNGKFDDLG